MISISNVKMSFGAQDIFDDVNFNINSRERIGLVGRNGSGKTTLFNLLNRSVLPEAGTIAVPKNYTIGYVQQHLKFTESTVLYEGCLGLRPQHIDDVWVVEKVLAGLGFTEDDMWRHPSEFSGGYQVRLNLAKVLVAEPHLLLLDEPTNYLDIISIRWLVSFLRKWQNELMIITHDRNFMDSVTTHTMIIHRKKARKIAGDTSKLYEQIAKEEEIHEKTRMNDEKKRKETEQFISRFRAKARLAGMVQSRVKALEKKEKLEKLERIETLEFSFNASPFYAKKIMEVKNISFGYKEDHLLIHGLSISIAKDDRICVIGKNGRGKSTLLKLLCGELTPSAGSLYGHPEIAFGYFGQTNIERLNVQRTIEEELIAADPDNNRKKARDICGSMMFQGDSALKKISVISGGERSRVLLGKILLSPVNMLLLDEPTNHLDMESCDSLLAALDSFPGASVIVTHNEMFLHELANRLIIFDDDKVFVFDGSYQEFLDQIGWRDEAQSNGSKKKASDNSVSRGDKKKLRAGIINQRSTVLKPLEKAIKENEHKIEKIEKLVHANNEKIVEASAKGLSDKIKEISLKNHQHKTDIDQFYAQLEIILVEHDKQSNYFEEQLNQLDLE
ncbi:MAG TPA: ABC transporter ATP-binding protein [Candidatus Margulisbacteria bacterium]|nr:MAG: ABC transporter ATP-binding protein [Candidatus Margulisbacteria bacterium GWD2_39_127]OGI04793.1 MAG: ABC transporter ATP-binding protein [Candidatus Margulisbacteria bacterium GWF2_38_17]OGI05738.1 MAG: ABC transporter ATP-binding protein [Candidatus Margulisbacteria bacterium GWE2_39_32]HAR62090.1 ABC transporter ATP-binding protein [Candidatus Margulisiibacteriota bacterium]HCT85788.1 ABC transporter ATP-binding protein [Candidatus Margulisiibacteriota bacterium]